MWTNRNYIFLSIRLIFREPPLQITASLFHLPVILARDVCLVYWSSCRLRYKRTPQTFLLPYIFCLNFSTFTDVYALYHIYNLCLLCKCVKWRSFGACCSHTSRRKNVSSWSWWSYRLFEFWLSASFFPWNGSISVVTKSNGTKTETNQICYCGGTEKVCSFIRFDSLQLQERARH